LLPALSRRERVALGVQRGVSFALAPIWAAVVALAVRRARLRFVGLAEAREAYARLRAEPGPLLVCANHLTLVDSFLVAWALGSPAWYVTHFASWPWNVPEATIFARTPWLRAATWTLKCVTIARGRRDAVARTLARVAHLLGRGEAVLVFPEGGRSRVGRVDVGARTFAVGRLLRTVPDARVLCVHLRGEGQAGFSSFPRRGERLHVALSTVEPKSEREGLRACVELSGQVLGELARLETREGAPLWEAVASPGGPDGASPEGPDGAPDAAAGASA
jgi:1-acyl-sn-glycerol-3-phosphate acyltransferase